MNTQQIHSDINGVTTSAVLDLQDGTDVEGHEYEIVSGPITQRISFQLGPVKEVGVNGLTSEAILAVLIHRTQHMDRQFPCQENKDALAFLRATQRAFSDRTRDRLIRGVEGEAKL